MCDRLAALVLLLALGGGCGSDLPPARAAAGCRRTDSAGSFMLRGLPGTEYWNCTRPEGSGLPRFVAHEGDATFLTGIESELALTPESEDDRGDHRIVMWVDRREGPGETPPISGDNRTGYHVAPVTSASAEPVVISLQVSPELPSGHYSLSFALADAGSPPDELVIGEVLEVPVQVISVGTGDIQIALDWDSGADLDLHVFPPDGGEIYFANMRDPSGGRLDLDSLGSCDLEDDRGQGNENVFWREGQAPPGHYRVEVQLFDDCDDPAVTIPYRVAVVLDQSELLHAAGELDPSAPVPVEEALSFDY